MSEPPKQAVGNILPKNDDAEMLAETRKRMQEALDKRKEMEEETKPEVPEEPVPEVEEKPPVEEHKPVEELKKGKTLSRDLRKDQRALDNLVDDEL